MSKISAINQCIKCASTFTSAERPLKLLPCLHSMCLDCLYGRIPLKTQEQAVSSPQIPTENESKDEKKNEQSDSTDADKSKPEDVISTENGTAVEESAASDKDKDDVSVSDKDDNVLLNSKQDSEDKKAVPSSNEETKTSDEKELTLEVEVEEKDKSEAEGKESVESNSVTVVNGNDPVEKSSEEKPSENVDAEKQTESMDTEKQTENVEVKPKPAKECPVCRDPVIIPVGSLMDNMFAALDLKQTTSSNANTSHVCTACEEGQEANSYCVQCEEWLCDSCVDAHKRVRVTKDHVISPKDQVSSATSKSPWEQQMMCKQHRQEQLKFFCEKCETMTCRDCQLMDHKEHKYQFLDQAAEQYKARLKGSLALMGEKRTKLLTSREEIEQKLMNCKEQKDTLQTDILRQADILVKGIRAAVWGVLSNLASFTDAATKRLNKEIDDVSDLIGKFDHCVQFMEDILKNGTSMSLLYSKGNVEAKCRKVYHTQVDPQSLKGNLMIQYKHDVNWLLGNLNKIGSIFVNGVRYPPEKITGQNQRHNSNSSSYQQQDPRAGLSATSPHLQHMANQPVPGQRGGGSGGDWNKFVQTVSTKPVVIHQTSSQSAGPPNMSLASMGGSAGSLPPQLTLPSRRAPNSAIGHSWAGMPGPNFSGHFSQGQVMPQQQHMGQPSRPVFTPMRLHHRPAAHPTGFNNQNDRGMQGSGNMRSPPNYRVGGEASGSSITGASSRSSHGTPDPARPASAGIYDANSRPDSGGGGPAMVDIKKERRDQSPDCVITSTSLRSEKQNLFQTSPMGSRISETVLEMQKNLDDVIRAVPMDLSDNLEQISDSKPFPEDNTSQKTIPSFSHQNSHPPEEVKSPTDEELRENWQGGNSMPGFSIPSNLQADPNDDYCACCHNGGDVLCCDTCPRVFHLQCHIPEIPSVPSGSFICTICEGDKTVEHEEFNSMGKRKTSLSDQEIKVCERILLDLFCHPSSIPFHEPVNAEHVPNYYKIITQPRDFTQIKSRLEKKNASQYPSIKSFVYDLRQVFINCAIYNKESSEVGKAGRMVRELFHDLVSKLMPQYQDFVKENPTPCFSALMRQGDSDLDDGDTGAKVAESNDGKRPAARYEENGNDESPNKRMKLYDS